MSQSQNIHDKDIKFNKNSTGLESTIHCSSIPLNTRTENNNLSANKIGKSVLSTHSDGNILKHQEHNGFKQKLVNKVKSWSIKDNKSPQNNNPTNSSKIVNDGDMTNSSIFSYSFNSPEKDATHSDSVLRRNVISEATSKVLTWDPWNKFGRKNKKENKKRKQDKAPLHLKKTNKSFSSTKSVKYDIENDEQEESIINGDEYFVCSEQDFQEAFVYTPYRSKKKSVNFANEVVVLYFTGEEILNKITEPLKKELEQQMRNKEMRRGHIDCTIMGNKIIIP